MGKNKINKNIIFYIAFSLYLFQSFLQTTTFKYIINNNFILFKLPKYISLILCIFLISLNKYDKKKFCVFIISIIAFFIMYIKTSYRILLDFILIIIAAKDVDMNKIIKIYFYEILILLLVTIISSKLGIIENLIYYRNGRIRQSLGIIYPTDFAAHFFYLVLSYLCIRKKKIKIYEIFLLIYLDFLVFKNCQARLDCSLTFVGIIIAYLYSKNIIKLTNKILQKIVIFSFVICSFFSIIFTINYNPENSTYNIINKVLSNRLRIGKSVYDTYGVHLLGEKIDEIGWGGNSIKKIEDYLYIDCSYMRILLKYGVIPIVIIGGYSIYIMKKFIIEKENLIALCLILVLINSMVAQHYIDFSYNFIILLGLSKSCNIIKKEEIENIEVKGLR